MSFIVAKGLVYLASLFAWLKLICLRKAGNILEKKVKDIEKNARKNT